MTDQEMDEIEEYIDELLEALERGDWRKAQEVILLPPEWRPQQ